MPRTKLQKDSTTKDDASAAKERSSTGKKRVGPRPVGAVVSAIKVLRYLGKVDRPLGATEIARATGMYPGTCYQVLRTLVSDDLVLFDADRKTYSISSGLGALVDQAREEPQEGTPKRRQIMDTLSRKHDATIYLIARLQGDKGVLVDFVHPASHAAYPIILSFDFLQVGAIGRLWAALLSPNRRGLKSAFDEMPWHRKPAFNEWMADVDAVRKIGYAADRGNVTPDVTVVAAPLFDPLGELSFFLTIMYLETEVDEKRLAQVGTEARIAAEEIRHELAMRSLMGSATAQK